MEQYLAGGVLLYNTINHIQLIFSHPMRFSFSVVVGKGEEEEEIGTWDSLRLDSVGMIVSSLLVSGVFNTFMFEANNCLIELDRVLVIGSI